MGAGLRTTSKGAERPPDPNVSCAAFLSRHLFFPGSAGYTNEGKQGFINEQIGELEGRGISLKDIVRALDNNAEKTEANTRAMSGEWSNGGGEGGSWGKPGSVGGRGGQPPRRG